MTCLADPTHVIGLFPNLLPDEFRKKLEYPTPPPLLTPSETEKGCLALVEYLTQVSELYHENLASNKPQPKLWFQHMTSFIQGCLIFLNYFFIFYITIDK